MHFASVAFTYCTFISEWTHRLIESILSNRQKCRRLLLFLIESLEEEKCRTHLSAISSKFTKYEKHLRFSVHARVYVLNVLSTSSWQLRVIQFAEVIWRNKKKIIIICSGCNLKLRQHPNIVGENIRDVKLWLCWHYDCNTATFSHMYKDISVTFFLNKCS